MDKENINNLHKDVKDIKDSLHRFEVSHTSRLTKLETTQKGFITIYTALFTAVVAYIANKFNIGIK